MIVEDLITASGAQPLPDNGLLAGGVYALADAGDKSLTVPAGSRRRWWWYTPARTNRSSR